MAETWWSISAPQRNAYDYPLGWQKNRLESQISFALDKPQIAQRVGYSEATRRVDEAARRKADAPFQAVFDKSKRMLDAGMNSEAVARYRDTMLATLRKELQDKPLRYVTLTEPQHDAMVALLAKRIGVWSLTAPEVARRVGLSAIDQERIDRERQKTVARFMAEERASDHTQMILEGAPSEAITATDEMRALVDTYRFSEESPSPEVKKKLDDLSFKSGRPIAPSWRRWLSSHREGLENRRKAGWRREAEAKVLDSLTTDQRARWDALVR